MKRVPCCHQLAAWGGSVREGQKDAKVRNVGPIVRWNCFIEIGG